MSNLFPSPEERIQKAAELPPFASPEQRGDYRHLPGVQLEAAPTIDREQVKVLGQEVALVPTPPAAAQDAGQLQSK